MCKILQTLTYKLKIYKYLHIPTNSITFAPTKEKDKKIIIIKNNIINKYIKYNLKYNILIYLIP